MNRHPLADKIPSSNQFDLRALHHSGSYPLVLQTIYEGGFKGAFLADDIAPDGTSSSNHDWDGDIARWGYADFRYNTPGNKKLFSDVVDDLPVKPEDTDGNHVYTHHAFKQWELNGEGNEDPFQISQEYGNCVDASWIEMMCSILGIQSSDSERGEIFKYLAAFYLYASRGYCSDGWWGNALAASALRHGWCPWALIEVDDHQLDFREEDSAEKWAARTVCRTGIPDWLSAWTSKNFTWQDGGITIFDAGIPGGLNALKTGHANKMHLHHGSNYTSGSSSPGNITRIGGHQQTNYGGDWSEDTLKFFHDAGIKIFSEKNYPCPQGQTWGTGWSGEVADKYWPYGKDSNGIMRSMEYVKNGFQLSSSDYLSQFSGGWGPKSEGAWIITAEQQLRYFSEAMAYIPGYVKGIPGETPPPPPPDKNLIIRGELVAEDGDGKELGRFIVVPKPVL